MVFLNVPWVFSNVLKALKVVLDGSKCVCYRSKGCFGLKVLVVFLRVSRLFPDALQGPKHPHGVFKGG